MGSKYIVFNNTLIDIADAVREKTNKSQAFTISEMVNEIQNLPTAKYANVIMPETFKGSNISSFSGETITHILDEAFMNCYSLTNIYIPNCVYIGPSAFANCRRATLSYFEKCEYIDYYAFSNYGYSASLQSLTFAKCSYIASSAFIRLSVSDLYLPNCEVAQYAAFRSAYFENIYANKLRWIGMYAFANNTHLKNIECRALSYIGNEAFYSCTALESISLPNCYSINQMGFAHCSNLIELNFLGVSQTVKLGGFGASVVFGDTPLVSGIGSIIVPSSLYSAFMSSSHWAYIRNRIVSA